MRESSSSASVFPAVTAARAEGSVGCGAGWGLAPALPQAATASAAVKAAKALDRERRLAGRRSQRLIRGRRTEHLGQSYGHVEVALEGRAVLQQRNRRIERPGRDADEVGQVE